MCCSKPFPFFCVLTLITASTFAYVSYEDIKGRSQSGLAPEGYTDTLNIPGQEWGVHDKDRPEPPIITPPTASTQEKPGSAPSDAIVLFDGTDLSHWKSGGGGEAKWKVADGYMEVNGTGSIISKEKFGDCQIHLEWSAPGEVKSKSQGRGNSGVIIMNRYEIQVLDSFNNRTYSDGQASAIYGQYPPQVNACRKPGEWQTYDIIFESPKFEGEELKSPAYATVIHNGVVVHHRTEILGGVAHKDPPQKYKAHGDEGIHLQDHGNPVRFRNIWVRKLPGYDSGKN